MEETALGGVVVALLTLAFVVLQVTGVIDLPWWWALAPAVLGLIAAVLYFISSLLD